MTLTRRDLCLTALAGLLPGALRAQGDPVAPPGAQGDPVASLGAQGDPVTALVAQVDAARLRDTVFRLASFPTRWTDHPDFPAVEGWMSEAFAAGGTGPVARQDFAMPSGKTRANIVAGDPMDPRGVLVIGAHMDSISQTPATLAPGANDNATGIAAMLEARRILSGAGLGMGVVAIAFAGEEQGLIGSTACAAIAAREGWPIALMLNLDMLGHRPARPGAPMIVEFDQGNAVPGNDAAARDAAGVAARMAAAHTTLATAHTDIWDSDYMPFEARGFACIGLFDGGTDSPHYHSTTDTPDRVDFGRLEQATRLVVATLATLAGTA